MGVPTILSAAGFALVTIGTAGAIRAGRRRLALAGLVVVVGFAVNLLRTTILAETLSSRVNAIALGVFIGCVALGTIQFLRIATAAEQA